MKKLLRTLCILCLFIIPGISRAQCGAGFSTVTLNWDYLDYFVYTGNYVSPNYLPSNALSQTQHFAFGTNRLTIAHNFADANSLGEDAQHTGEGGSFGTGADIHFNGNGTITFTFESDVTNLKFSIYDLDQSQQVTVTSKNLANTAQNVTMTKANAASTIVIAGSGTVSALATSLVVGAIANNLNTAVININIPTAANSVTLAFGGTAGDFWISDITGCNPVNFPTNYYAVSKPFTGMPGYILHAFDKSVYALDPATGVTKLLFTDPMSLGSSSFINSMGYDPYNRILYYVFSLTATPASNKILRKYDFNTDVMSTVVADINTIGIPTTNFSGIESGAASFYNGSYFLGIETPSGARNSGRESIVWRIDFDATNTPYRACQVFGTPADDGAGTLLHDWSDFSINNGMLYDFDGAGTTTQTDIYQMDMNSGNVVNFNKPVGYTPGQPAVDWQGNIYQLHAINPGTTPYLALYNPATGTIGARTNITSNPAYVPAIPSLGDGGEAFRPLCDFGDAPATYDPAAGDPAVHDLDPLLYLGSSESKEWVQRGQTVPANSDNFDDALSYIPTFNPLTAKFLTQATVFNNTGVNATMVAWLDYNGNGVFDAAEALTFTVPSNAAPQLIWLYWNGISSPLANGTNTYLRIRLTRAANGLTAAKPTGYFPDGEVEDYRVLVNSFALSTQLVSFDAQKVQNKAVQLDWNTASEQTGTVYELQRSINSQDWSSLFLKNGSGVGSPKYTYTDNSPLRGNSYYRLKMQNPDGTVSYSQIRMISFENNLSYALTPNPAADVVKLTLNSDEKVIASVAIMDVSGRTVFQQDFNIEPGTQTIPLNTQKLNNGMYSVQVKMDKTILNQKLVIKK